ncbi:MAG TPA: serine/threonine-protein kinase [Polyangiales bacterium]|nr:serine/threonine-protein kinase [Polyangiales bacterium]
MESHSSIQPGSPPSDPVAARLFLQSRVTLYLEIALAIWTVAFFTDRGITALQYGTPFHGPTAWYIHAHYLGLSVLVAFLLVIRRAKCSIPVLHCMEVFATLLQAVLSASLLGQLHLASRPEILALFAATLFLLLRAGLIPGRTLGAFAVGVLSLVPAIVLTVWLYGTRPPVPGSELTPTVAVLYVLEWGGFALVATTAIHRVIYGLRERVQELGQYTLLHKLGEGGMGVVYAARHALLRRPTAVKLLPAHRTSPAGIARFEREVQLTAELAHPNVVAVYDFGRTPDGSFYYAMELLDGVDLQRLVEDEGPLPPARVAHLLLQAADALTEAHAVGLIHRDIKPANLLVSNRARRPDHLTMLDFGLAKDVSQTQPSPLLSTEEIITGTPLYMSPEAITDPGKLDGRSDIYALGAVGYWLLTASAPFSGRTIVEVCAAHLHTEPEPPSRRLGRDLPADLERLILDCLAKSQAARPASAAVLLERLRALTVGGWSHEQALACWSARASRARSEPVESLEYARTMAIARRVAREAE